jgi:TRAP-type C4-dicarboxylate transport system permease small subunit
MAFAQDIVLNPNEGSGTDHFATDIGAVFRAVLNFVLVIAVLLVFGYLVLGGIEWITSGGDKSKTESARNKITAAVIGLIILVSAYAILTVVLQFLGFNPDSIEIPTLNQFN